MKKLFLSLLLTWSLLAAVQAQAQTENSGTIENEGGTIDNHPTWVNAADGVYLGSDNGVFNHFGPAAVTFSNHGSYTASTGHTDVFKGPNAASGAQEIAGSRRPAFFNVDFANGASSEIKISNTAGIGIAGNLNFTNGITTTLRNLHSAGAIVFGPEASYSNAETDAQHVNGYVSKIGNTAFVFPVGSGADIRALAISAPSPVTAHIGTAWIPGDPTITEDPSDTSPLHPASALGTPLMAIADAGQWDWVQVEAPDTDITVTVSIPDVSKFALSENLRLVGWDGEKWIDLSHGATASGVAENSTLEGIIPAGTEITALGIGSTERAMPVRLVSFEAKPLEKNQVLLTWKTAGEFNNDYFQVEHSLDAKTFEAVGKVKGKGTLAAENTDYSFTHHLAVPSGTHYYRLKQVDFDGSFAYSEIRVAKLGERVTLVYPNPATDKIYVEIENWKGTESVELFDAAGRKVFQTKETKALLKIDSRFFSAGIYTVRIRYADGAYTNQKLAVTN